jgi:hypothetical protein
MDVWTGEQNSLELQRQRLEHRIERAAAAFLGVPDLEKALRAKPQPIETEANEQHAGPRGRTPKRDGCGSSG